MAADDFSHIPAGDAPPETVRFWTNWSGAMIAVLGLGVVLAEAIGYWGFINWLIDSGFGR